MATINVRRDVTDPFYRYKMERLQTKIEGKGNGVKTVVVNLNNVAQSLNRSPAYIIKYFGFEIGAQANAKVHDDRWIINGTHEAVKLQDYLDGFIQKFVLCQKCHNPETTFVFEDNDINLDCKACGKRSTVDPRAKLCSFILKNEATGKGKKDKASKKSRRDRVKDENNDGNTTSSASDGNNKPDVDVEIQNIEKKVDEVTTNKKMDTNSWELDLSEEAVAERARGLPSEMQHPKASSEAKAALNKSYEDLGVWFDEEIKKSKNGVSDIADLDIYRKLSELNLEKEPKTLFVLAQTLFDDRIAQQIPSRSGFLIKLVETDKHRERLLNGTIRFLTQNPKLIKQLPVILLKYYEDEIVSEDYLVKWWSLATGGSSKASKREKSPFDVVDEDTRKQLIESGVTFIDWLKTAEEGSESESESDEE